MACEVKEEKIAKGEEEKPDITDLPATIPSNPVKSSMEILSELFNSFDAEPPLIIKKEKTDTPSKKSKKSKKKHKHSKDKKHKKKDKKRKRDSSSSSERSEIDLAEILIKQEKETTEKKIKIEGTDISLTLPELALMKEIKKEKGITQTPTIEEEKEKESIEKENSPKKSKDSSKEMSKETSSKKIKIKLKTTNLDDKDKSQDKPDGEEGEISDTDNAEKKKKKKRKHKADEEPNKRKKHRSEDKNIKILTNDLRNKIRAHRDERHPRDDSFYNGKSREKDDFYSRRKSDEDDDFYGKKPENEFYKRHDREDDGFYKAKEHHRSRDHDKDKHKSSRRREDGDFYRNKEKNHDFRYRPPHERQRDRERRHRSSSRDSTYIDKKKLLAIARKNAIQMMKSGNLPGALTLGPQAQEKVIAAIKAGGKTIEELTDFCKTLSKKEALGELSSGPEEHSDSDTDRPFHHPFQIKDRPTSITMNIKNSVPLPIKSTQERSTELRMQFPVSSGQLHRKTESEWVPVVTSKKTEYQTPAIKPIPPPVTTSTPAALLAIEAPPATVENKESAPGPQVFPTPTTDNSGADISSIVSQRLTAMRKLQENPNDVQALTEIYKSNKEMQCWAESKQQPGQFTGTTGAQILSQAELSSGYQAWAKKDQLQSATPVSGGMGMHLLQKMGWKPGEGLGKEKTGALEPLLLEVKLDKKGLVANEEQKRKKKLNLGWAKSLQNKHPVSLLGEYTSKKKLGAPEYTLCFECGPDHKKNFLFRVTIAGVEYKPNIASPNKKEAKANAATVCLQELGLLPPTPMQPPPQ